MFGVMFLADDDENADEITKIKLKKQTEEMEYNKVKDATKLCGAAENQWIILSRFITKTEQIHVFMFNVLYVSRCSFVIG